MLCKAPKLRDWTGEFNADANLALHAPPDIYHSTLLLGLVPHVRQKQFLPFGYIAVEYKQAAVFICVDGLGLLMKRLLIRVRAIDKQESRMRMAQPLSAVTLGRPGGLRGFLLGNSVLAVHLFN